MDAFEFHGTGKVNGAQLVNKLPAFNVNQNIMTVLTRTCNFSLFWARWIQSSPSQRTCWRSILILSFYLCLGPASDFCIYFLIPPTFHMPHASHPRLVHHLFIYWESWSCSLCSFLHMPRSSFLLGPKIFVGTLFLNILNQ